MSFTTGATLQHQEAQLQGAKDPSVQKLERAADAAEAKEHQKHSDISKMKTEEDGSFKRKPSSFRNTIQEGGEFPPEKGACAVNCGGVELTKPQRPAFLQYSAPDEDGRPQAHLEAEDNAPAGDDSEELVSAHNRSQRRARATSGKKSRRGR